MKLLVEEYFDVLLTIIGGLIIIAIIVSSVISTNIIINHNEKINPVNLHSDRIISFDCKDVVIDIDCYDKVKDKTIKKDDNKDFFEYIFLPSSNLFLFIISDISLTLFFTFFIFIDFFPRYTSLRLINYSE